MSNKPDVTVLSRATVTVMEQLINNQNLVKLLYYNSKYPYNEPDLSLPATDLINTKIHPTAFNPNAPNENHAEVNVIFPLVAFKNNQRQLEGRLYFEVVCSKDAQIIHNNGSDIQIRPLSIINEIVGIFVDESYPSVGEMIFQTIRQRPANDKYDVWILEAEVGVAKLR